VNIQLKQGVPVDQVATLKKLLKALTPFIDLRDTMPLQLVRAFTLVATEEGRNVTWYADKAGISPSLMTRHLADIGETDRYHEPGFGLVEQFSNVRDKRERLMRLTPKGRGIAQKICNALE
jgi:DNA-binding MarR family transcriptional regulator